MSNLSPAALDVLRASTAQADRVILPAGQLDRPLYEEVNDALMRLGGKWKGGRIKAHLFTFYDPRPLLAAVIETGEMPEKNPTAFFPSPAPVVDEILMAAGLDGINEFIDGSWRILEPSAGTGAIAEAVRRTVPAASLDVIESLPINAAVLRAKGFDVHQQSFLDWRPEYQYQTIVMNPPFAVAGDPLAFITHIEHAWSLLKPYGRLVSVVPPAFTTRTDKRCTAFRRLVCEYGEMYELPDKSFAASGTTIKTAIVALEKVPPDAIRRPTYGYHCEHCWAADLWVDNDRETVDARDRLRQRLTAIESAARVQEVAGFYDDVERQSPDQIFLIPECHKFLTDTLMERAE